MDDIYRVSGTELARRIRDGETTSAALVDAAIDATQRVNPLLNAVVATRFDQARDEAKSADETLQKVGPNNVGPFHGVPCSIKECFALEGMPNTSGLVSRVGLRATEDATAVARYRKAGAIPIGVTNTSEVCMWMESNNKVYGRSNNPYDITRIVGGSSGGEGAIVGSGAVPFGLGSDVGGSIRMPAFFNGVFGHKASSGLIPNTGQFPAIEGEGLKYLATGPLARRAEDLWPLISLLAGPDGADDVCQERTLPSPDSVDISSLRVLSVETNHLRRPSPDLRNAQRAALRRLAPHVADAQRTDVPEFKKSLQYWGTMLGSAPGPSFGELLGLNGLTAAGLEVLRLITGRSEHTVPAVALALVEGPFSGSERRTQKTIAAGRRFRDTLNQLLEGNTVMLFPSYPSVAPKHYWPQLRPIDWLYTAIFNVTELPVTQVPLGVDSNGIPLGIQVVAAHGHDHLCVAVAQLLESEFGGWQPPALLDAL